MVYKNNDKTYKVESVTYGGTAINVNGTTITKQDSGTYSVFIEGDEIGFNSFDEAYDCAMNRQKDTVWL